MRVDIIHIEFFFRIISIGSQMEGPLIRQRRGPLISKNCRRLEANLHSTVTEYYFINFINRQGTLLQCFVCGN